MPAGSRRGGRRRHRLRDRDRRILAPLLVTASILVGGPGVVLSEARGELPVGRSIVDIAPGAVHQRDRSAPVEYRHPVDAPVIDGFRMDNGPYGAGNRGLEYGTSGGEPVVASADGRVSYAGNVAGRLVVSLTHADGRISSLTHMRTVEVQIGDAVTAGSGLGTADVGLHFGIREDGRYIDPVILLAGPVDGSVRGPAYLVEP